MQRKVTAFLICTSLVALSAGAVSVNGGTPPYENSILDLAVTNCGDNTVSILIGDSEGGFGGPQDYSVGDDPRGIGRGDFNGDGILDLAVTNNDADSVSVLIGDGEGAFGDRQDYSVGDGPKGVVAGDFDKDGDLDLAVTNCYDNDISILIGDGEGNFGSRQDYPVREWPRHIVAGDFDKDGDLDLVLTNCYGNVVSILLNDGTADFSNRQDYPVGNHPIGIATGDFNGDEVLDLAVANYGDNDVSVLLNNGTGDFSNRQDYPVGNHPIGIATGDFNGDEVLDLVVTNRCDNYVSVLIGDGEGGFGDRQDYPVGDSLVGIVAGDFNGDDDLDLAVTDENDDVVIILLNDGTGDFSNHQGYPVGDHPWGIVTGDFNPEFKLYIPHLQISTETGTRIFYPTDDTWLNKPDHPGDPLGDRPDLWVRNAYGAGGSDIYQFDALVRFDVSSILSGTTILSATLNLYYYHWYDNDPVGRNLNLYRITSDWDEETATWNTQPSYALDSTTYSPVPESTDEWMGWDVTSDVQGFVDQLYIDYGWKITDENHWGQPDIPIICFRSKEYRPFIRGDATSATIPGYGDGNVAMSDVIYILKVCYVPGTPPPLCWDALDVNDNGEIDCMVDAIYLLKHLYHPGCPPPPPPFGEHGAFPDDCGPDPTPDDLDCEDHPCQYPPTVSPSKSVEIDGKMVFGDARILDCEVIVPVYLQNNRPLSGFAYTISYDATVLSFKSAHNVKLATENFDFFSARPNEEIGSVNVGTVVDLGLKKNLTPGYHEVTHLIFEFKTGKLEETILRFTDVQLVDTEAKPLSAHTNTCTIRISSSIPETFALHQAFPNPFTGETSIRYQLPKENHVVLKVYNGAGQMVNTLVNAMQKPGYYSVQWNGEDAAGMKVASGIYFYKIETEDYSSTKKMILLR